MKCLNVMLFVLFLIPVGGVYAGSDKTEKPIQDLVNENQELLKKVNDNNKLITGLNQGEQHANAQNLHLGAMYERSSANMMDRSSSTANSYGVALGYKFYKNFIVEGRYTEGLYRDFPADGIDTKLTKYMVNFKYDYETSLRNIHLWPYLGYQMRSVYSPGVSSAHIDPFSGYNEATLVAEETRLT